jgi:hypothetical protein
MGGCAVLALGVALAAPARAQSVVQSVAQSVISGDIYASLDLGGYGPGQVSVTAGSSVTSNGLAALSDSTGGVTLENAGSISAADGVGIFLGASGAVDNQSGGAVSGMDAIRLNAGGNVQNEAGGAIRATRYGVLARNAAGSVSNAGVIAAGYDGVSLDAGGSVTNAAGGSVFGAHIGVYTGNGVGVVANSGVISARTGDAVSLYSGGSLSNTASGQLLGGYSGVYEGGRGASVQNAGLISGPAFGVYIAGAGSLVNSGTIVGGIDGVIAVAPEAVVTNTGIIKGNSAGVRLGRGDTLDNSGGITGGTGVLVKGAGASIVDAGLIAGSNGEAVQFEGGASSLTLGTGAVIQGGIDGGGTDSSLALTGSGVLGSDIRNFGADSVLNVASGANWTASGNWMVGTVLNSGTLQPGIVGSPLKITGSFVQLSSGTLRIVVTPAGASQMSVTGTATLGGALVYVLAPGNYVPVEGAFLTAGGGLIGSFASVTTQLAAGETASAGASVQAIDPPGVFNYRLGAFAVAPADDGLFARTRQAMTLDADHAGDTLLGHAMDAPAPACSRAGALPGGSSAQAGIAQALASTFCGAGGWVEAAGTAMNQPGTYDAQTAGFLAGVGREVNAAGTRLGLAVGYDATSLTDAQSGKASADTMRLGVYGAQPLGRFVLSGDVMGGFISANTTRATGAGAAAAAPGGSVVSGVVQLAMPMRLARFSLSPSMGVGVAHVSLGRFSESARQTAFALSGAESSGTSVRPYLRLAVSRAFVTAARVVWTPQLGLGVDYEAGNPGGAVNVTAADGTGYVAGTKRLDPLAGEMTAGLTASRGNVSLVVSYGAQVAGNWTSQSAEAAVRVVF